MNIYIWIIIERKIIYILFDMKKSVKGEESKENTKKAGRYKLTKGLNTKLSSFSTLYRVFNFDTKQVWHAKVIDNELIGQYCLEQALQFNIQCLLNAKQCENIIFVEEVFQKSGNTFIIQQQYDKTLVQTVTFQHPFISGNIQDILSDVLSALLELYHLGYMTRSLRPEHIVSVDGVWKIQSFVLSSQIPVVQSEYCWSSKFASPQDRAKSEQLSDRLIDEQLVWSVGILGLYMILGPDFTYQQINKDNYIPWGKVKEQVGQILYRFLVKSLKVDFKDRMRLSQMYQNELFSHLDYKKGHHPFQSYSKFYSDDNDKSVKKEPISLSGENLKKFEILKNDIERFKYFSQVQKYVQELPYKSSYDINLIRYLSFKICFENIQKIKNEITVWKREYPVLRNYQPLKDIEEDLNLFVNRVKQNKINYGKNIRGIELSKSEVNEIKGSFLKEVNDEKNIQYTEIIDLYSKLAGSVYTLLYRDCEKREDESKSRTICFYSLAVYLLHFHEADKFDNLNAFYKNGVLSLCRLINEAPVKLLISLTQKLIKQHFATTNAI